MKSPPFQSRQLYEHQVGNKLAVKKRWGKKKTHIAPLFENVPPNNLINHLMNFLRLLRGIHWLSRRRGEGGKKLIPQFPCCGRDHYWNFSPQRRTINPAVFARRLADGGKVESPSAARSRACERSLTMHRRAPLLARTDHGKVRERSFLTSVPLARSCRNETCHQGFPLRPLIYSRQRRRQRL